MSEVTELYRHWDKDDNVLYIGISVNASTRTIGHSRHGSWFSRVVKITIERYDTREEAMRAEAKAIMAENPPYNVVHIVKEKEPTHFSNGLCTPKDVAAFFCVPTTKIHQLLKRDEFPVAPAYVISGTVRFLINDVIDYIVAGGKL